MFPHSFHYHRASSLPEAAAMLAQLGAAAKLLAGGQSLVPLMKLRLAQPAHLVDLGFVPDAAYIRAENGSVRLGAMARHAEIAESEVAARIPILHDCAAGIADVQIRNRGTIGGSVAEADPSGDWGVVLMSLPAEVRCIGPKGARTIPIDKFFLDAYTSALAPEEVVSEILVKSPGGGSGGAYIAFKRSAPVYASASAAVQLSLDGDTCREARIVLGAVGLTAVRAAEAENELRGKPLGEESVGKAAEAARAACDPQPDMRGSAEYKKALVAALVKRAIAAAGQRARGQAVEVSHIYA